jgi:hypothetical protein
MPVLLIPVVVVLFAAIAYFAWLAQKARREALAALAAERGWRFDPAKDYDHDDEYAHFEVFRKGSSRAAYNTLYGSVEIDGRPYRVKMGDFRYTIQHGKSSLTHHRSYLIMHMPFATPNLLIRGEGLFDKLRGALGFDDIDFESEAFSRRFYVMSSDKKFAYDVVHPRMMEWLMAKKVPLIDIERGRCCLVSDRGKWEPDEFSRWLRRVDEFFQLWPDYLLSRLDG